MNKVLLTALIGLVLFSGCVQQQPAGNRTSEIFQSWLTDTKNIKTIESAYYTILDLPKESFAIKGKSYVKGNMRMDEFDTKVGEETVTFRTYMYGDEVYVCNTTAGRWSCSKSSTIISLSRENQLKILENIYSKKAFVFEDVEEKVISNQSCKLLKINTDIQKLSKEEKYFILAAGGLSTISEPDRFASAIKSFKISMCIIDGISLGDETNLELKTAVIRRKTEITSFRLNQEIPDDVFTLPG